MIESHPNSPAASRLRLLTRAGLALPLVLTLTVCSVLAQAPTLPRFPLPASGPVLSRATNAGNFYDVVGRRAAVFGNENRGFEAWVYPLKILDDARFDFAIDGYAVPAEGPEVMRRIEVRPEATTLVYTHPAFTVRQITYAPIDEQGVVILLDIETVRPLNVAMSFRPDLGLMWPAGLMTGFVGFEADEGRYFTGEETQKYYGMVGSPAAKDVSIQPYQEEPKDVPNRFELRITPEQARAGFIPIVIAGGTEGREACAKTYDRLLAEAERLYGETVRHYRRLERTVQVVTPDARLDEAYAWAKVGMDKGLATNPTLGTGLVAGYRTSGNSERPGFAWFFGRDALWTTLATTAVGDYPTTRQAIEFLARFQRDDGKIPHEISQSADLLNWFEEFPYPWASADASPLFVIALADYHRQTGDTAFLRKHYETARRAYDFAAATDADGNGLIENTGVGHGWVEGGEIYPPHEELYLQALFVQASRDIAELTELTAGDAAFAKTARAAAARTLGAVEELLWLPDEGYYAFGTAYPKAPELAEARRGPITEADNKANNEVLVAGKTFEGTPEVVHENTALQGVPLWWGLLDSTRAQGAITHFGRGALATGWGARILDKNAERYDPMAYHNGSVWPLFTGWTSMGAYKYGRPHVGAQALYANALLTTQDALGYVTELLSGDFNTAFGRSSHHQIWSEAMVAAPLLHGMLGVEAGDGGRTLRVAPQLPADWDSLRVEKLPLAGGDTASLAIRRDSGTYQISVDGLTGQRLELAPAFPRDAEVGRVVDGGGKTLPVASLPVSDVQFVTVSLAEASGPVTVTYELARRGSDVVVPYAATEAGAANGGLRVLRSEAGAGQLKLTVEGRSGSNQRLSLVSDRAARRVSGGELNGRELTVAFAGGGDAEGWVRQEVLVEF